MAEDAIRWAAEGFSTFKLKLGAGDDVGQVRAVREAVGPDARIRVDANATWDVATAKQTLAALEPLDVELVEQPVATLEEAIEVASATSIPIAGDESVGSRADAERAVAMGACGLAGLKLSKVGGPEAAIEIAEVLPSFVSSALDGPVGIAAAAQVAQTLREAAGAEDPGLAHGLATQRLFASTIASVQCELRERNAPPARGSWAWAWRSTRRRWTPTAFRVSDAWTPRTAIPPWPPPSPRSWRGAGCARRSSLPAPAPPRWRWRSGASRRST